MLVGVMDSLVKLIVEILAGCHFTHTLFIYNDFDGNSIEDLLSTRNEIDLCLLEQRTTHTHIHITTRTPPNICENACKHGLSYLMKPRFKRKHC